MTYVSLYRKWRPRVFTDVVGQEHVVRTLTNALDQQRIAHAYLFAGPRGTGKTTLARLLAKGLNCKDGPTGSPCGDCDQCVRIAEGSSVDVLEIDGASNRGIDEIREIRERVKYAPAEGGYKVYIIDEVHMLTTEAFNALLKVLEEPPRHVVFIFATTEQHKIPATILSRCQNFEFRSLSAAEILQQLDHIAQGEEAQVESEALALIARHAEGGMRDAIGFLDQAISFSEGTIDSDLVAEVLGVVRTESLEALADALAEKDLKRCFLMVREGARSGYDMRQWTADAARYFRDLMLLALIPGETDMVPLTEEARQRGMELANRIGVSRLVDIVERLGAAESDMRDAPSPELVLELALIDLVQGGIDGVQGLTERVAALENRITSAGASGVTSPFVPERSASAPFSPTPTSEAVPQRISKSEVAQGKTEPFEGVVDASKRAADASKGKSDEPKGPEIPAKPPSPEESDLLTRVRNIWPDLLEALRARKAMQQAAFLREGVPGMAEGDTITVFFSPNHQFHQANIEAEQNKIVVETELSKLIGQEVKIKPQSGSPPSIAELNPSSPVVETPSAQRPSAERPSAETPSGQRPPTERARGESDREEAVPDQSPPSVQRNDQGRDGIQKEDTSDDDLLAEAMEEPLVKAALDLFGGTITKIERKDDETS